MNAKIFRPGAIPAFGFLLALTATAAPSETLEVAAANAPTNPAIAASPLLPPRFEREVAGIVGDMLERHHYEKHPLDDEISSRWLDNYLDSLDYNRMIFLASDIEEFEAYRTTMDDGLKERDPRITPAVVMYERYRMRMRERVAAVREVLAGDVDVHNAETWVPGRHDADLAWPATAAQANDLWRQRIEEEWIGGMLDDESADDIRDRLGKRYDRTLQFLDEVESTDVMEVWLGSLAHAYDPHSTWFKPARNDDFDIEITNSVSGIGAQLRKEGDYTEVVEVIPGGPAEHSKRLRKADKILSVAQGADQPVDVVGWRIDKVVKLIRGEIGTEVRLHIKHADGEGEVVKMIRDRVTLEKSATEHSVRQLGDRRLGVLDLPSFYVAPPTGDSQGRSASGDLKAALAELRSDDVDGIVLDLRGNGGGSLIEAIDVAGLFLTAGPMVQVRTRAGQIEALFDPDPAVHWLKPMVVLVDATSASASEIVAGALQDYGRAVVVGAESTHGKGTVQQVAPLTRQLRGRYDDDVGGALKLTIQKFYRVSGSSTQNRGVISDLVLPSPWDGLDVYESDLDNALAWDRIPPTGYVRSGELEPMFEELRSRSKARVKASEDFSDLSKILEEREALRARTEVSLVFEERRTEFEARKARAGFQDKPETEEGDEAEEEEAVDYLLDEALAILADLVELTA